MSNYHIRISRSYNELHQWITDESFNNVVVYEHESDDEVKRTHVHMWVKNVSKSTDTLKNHIRKVIGKVDKSDWYFTTVNKKNELWNDNVITYMSKGVLTPKYCKGFTAEEIEDFRSKWVTPESPLSTQDGKLVLKRPVKETVKKTKRELIQAMLELYTTDMETYEVVELIRNVLIKNNEVLGMYKVMDLYDGLMCYGNKEYFVNMVTQKLNSRQRI